MTIDGGTFNAYCGNGSQLRGGSSVQKDSTLTINGGTFKGYVFAGAYSMGGMANVNGDTTLVINGGTFKSYVFGGCGANNSDNGDKTKVCGAVSVLVDTSENAVSFESHLLAGSMGCCEITAGTSMGVPRISA